MTSRRRSVSARCAPTSMSRATTDQLVAMLNGAQVLAVLSPERSSPERLTAMLDDFLLLLR